MGKVSRGRKRPTYQEDDPGGIVGEDDQANSNEAESHHLVCPCGLGKREGSEDEMTIRLGALMEGASRPIYDLKFSFTQQLYRGADSALISRRQRRASAFSSVHGPGRGQSGSECPIPSSRAPPSPTR